jgi:hypothetical protein
VIGSPDFQTGEEMHAFYVREMKSWTADRLRWMDNILALYAVASATPPDTTPSAAAAVMKAVVACADAAAAVAAARAEAAPVTGAVAGTGRPPLGADTLVSAQDGA